MGTSVFHSYVHDWVCQLSYNPRLNRGWGLSDGEGMERKWSDLSPLVALLRYVTKEHRLIALNLRSIHMNDVSRANAGMLFEHTHHSHFSHPDFLICSVQSMVSRSAEVHRRLLKAEGELVHLNTLNPIHTIEYFERQWGRQRELQMDVISETAKQKKEQITLLLAVEEQLVEAR